MSEPATPYTRLGRVLARMDFSWMRTEHTLDQIAQLGIAMNRFRPAGPHALWIAGHLAFVEAGALAHYQGADANPLADWKDLFGKGSPAVDDAGRYPSYAEIVARLKEVRAKYRDYVAGLSDEDLDRTDIHSDHLPIQDLQSHVEFMIWHDSHHLAQLQGISKTAEEAILRPTPSKTQSLEPRA